MGSSISTIPNFSLLVKIKKNLETEGYNLQEIKKDSSFLVSYLCTPKNNKAHFIIKIFMNVKTNDEALDLTEYEKKIRGEKKKIIFEYSKKKPKFSYIR